MPILVIVESPGKIKKISEYLGDNYIVKASFGHCRDLDPKSISKDVENNFKPTYKIINGKNKVVRELRGYAKECSEVILAADEDREGEIYYFLPIVADAESGFGGVLTTHELVKALIEAGADDLGGIAPEPDHINPNKDWPNLSSLESELKDREVELKLRMPVYDEYIKDKWCPKPTMQALNNMLAKNSSPVLT